MDAVSRSNQTERRPASILFISSGLWHPSLLARWELAQALRRSPALNFQTAPSLEILPHLDLSAFQGIVLYFHHRSISPAALKAFESYVAGGGGILALHSAAASFKDQPGYYEILGGRFVYHGPVTRFEVIPAGSPGEGWAGLPRFWVRDELYRHEFNPAVSVQLHTEIDGEREPVLWTYRYGMGCICCCSLGHTAGALRHPQVRQALLRGLAWAAGAIQPGESGE